MAATLLVAGSLAWRVLHATELNAQANEQQLAQQLRENDVVERRYALEATRRLGVRNTDPELRTALIGALAREARVHVRRWEAGRRGEVLQPLEDPEFVNDIARVVAELRDPEAIPALTAALGSASVVPHALAGFGEQAAPLVLAVVLSADSWYEAVNEALIALRFMVEMSSIRPLSPGTLSEVRRAAELRLTRPGDPPGTGTTLRWAIDLAVALDDPVLRRIVEVLATDWNAVVARGIEDAGLVDQTQKRAIDRLAGVPALPRPEP
jgi:hypothetical protein